jgi:hypothetical protein
MPNVAAIAPTNAGHDSSGRRRRSNTRIAPSARGFLDAPVVTHRRGDVMPIAFACRGDERADVTPGSAAAAVTLRHMKHAGARGSP